MKPGDSGGSETLLEGSLFEVWFYNGVSQEEGVFSKGILSPILSGFH